MRQRLALALVFAVAAASQIAYTVDVFQVMRDDYPVRPFAVGEPWPTVRSAGTQARLAGLRDGDRIVAIDGRAPQGLLDAETPVRGRRPGETIPVTIERDGQRQEVAVIIPRSADRTPAYFAIVSWLLIPIFSLLLGFWVAAVRAHDYRAWMMLGILIGMSQMMRSWGISAFGWGAAIGVPAALLRNASVQMWGISMMLFGIYFPQRWNVDRKVPWAKYVVLVGPLYLMLRDMIDTAVRAFDYPLASSLPRVNFSDAASFGILAPCISIFFTAIAIKYNDPDLDSDDRRRLKLLYWGSSTALMPMFVLFLYSLAVRGRAPNPGDGIELIVALLAMGLFPLTLAYVVVVQRAMDVRMVIRQGLQYALAAKGVRVLQGLLIAGVIVAAAAAAGSDAASRPRRITYVAIGVTCAFLIREFADRLRSWVDRKFFREAYQSEQILSELSEQVRGILDADALLETVTRKISESLHVERIAVLLRDGPVFRPALGAGHGEPFALEMPADAVVTSREGVRVVPGGAAPFEAQLLLPLTGHKELLGFIGLGPKKSEEPYSRSDTNLLKTVAAQTGLALENARLSHAIAHEVAQRELMNREIEIARDVQQRLFPQTLPEIPALEYAGFCRPARGVGGDYYDFLSLTSGRLGLVIADVSGKGIPAALLMASLQASVRGQSQGGSGQVAELMSNVNKLICDASPENRYATFFYSQFDPVTRKLVYSNGGHNNPAVVRGDEVLRLEIGGPPVGLFKFSRYEQAEVQLEPGDLLVLFTDGVSEAENAAQDEFGEDALIAAARSCLAAPSAEIIQVIMQRADAFAAGAPQHDDMTLVIAQVG
jgi:sigma-B regulation protein RsbU (phosphoserine phosphatase)